MSMFNLPKPDPFLVERARDDSKQPSICGLCVGYESTVWRGAELARHIMEWLPEFALSGDEFRAIQHSNSVALIRKAAQTVYATDKYTKRGEFGELFLHAAIRQVFDSLPAISKIWAKSALNDTVKGFDAVHVVGPPTNMELWLGEAKFYHSITSAVNDVVKELHEHIDAEYLRSEFLLITNKIEDNWPHAQALRRLLHPNTSLDEVFSRTCIPVLLTYDSDCVKSHQQSCASYITAFEKEIQQHYDKFTTKLNEKALPSDLRIHLFLMPLHEKKALVGILHERLKAWQNI